MHAAKKAITCAARLLGYAGEIGIIRLFRKYEGTTPGDYRAQHK